MKGESQLLTSTPQSLRDGQFQNSSPVPLSPYGQPTPELLPCFRGAPQSGEGYQQGSNPGAAGGGEGTSGKMKVY